MRLLHLLLLVASTEMALADSVVPTTTIRANTILTAADVELREGVVGGGYSDISQVVGKETTVVLYTGRPIKTEEISEPSIIERNQLVPLFYQSGGLTISTVGRSLDRAPSGETIRIMNVGSRSVLLGMVLEDGSVQVTQR